jgi:single-strand DNA-binding protein
VKNEEVSMNHTMIAGNLGTDPEVRFTNNGTKVTTLRIACNTKKAGKDETTWWRVTIWGDQFDKMVSFLKKGSSVIVHGEMSKPEIYTDKNGTSQVSLNLTASSISFSPFGRSDKPAAPQENASGNAHNGGNSDMSYSYYDQMAQGQQQAAHATISDEEIPF